MEPVIMNYIEISGETFLFDSLPTGKKKEVAEQLQDKIMLPIGYKRVPVKTDMVMKLKKKEAE